MIKRFDISAEKKYQTLIQKQKEELNKFKKAWNGEKLKPYKVPSSKLRNLQECKKKCIESGNYDEAEVYQNEISELAKYEHLKNQKAAEEKYKEEFQKLLNKFKSEKIAFIKSRDGKRESLINKIEIDIKRKEELMEIRTYTGSHKAVKTPQKTCNIAKNSSNPKGKEEFQVTSSNLLPPDASPVSSLEYAEKNKSDIHESSKSRGSIKSGNNSRHSKFDTPKSKDSIKLGRKDYVSSGESSPSRVNDSIFGDFVSFGSKELSKECSNFTDTGIDTLHSVNYNESTICAKEYTNETNSIPVKDNLGDSNEPGTSSNSVDSTNSKKKNVKKHRKVRRQTTTDSNRSADKKAEYEHCALISSGNQESTISSTKYTNDDSSGAKVVSDYGFEVDKLKSQTHLNEMYEENQCNSTNKTWSSSTEPKFDSVNCTQNNQQFYAMVQEASQNKSNTVARKVKKVANKIMCNESDLISKNSTDSRDNKETSLISFEMDQDKLVSTAQVNYNCIVNLVSDNTDTIGQSLGKLDETDKTKSSREYKTASRCSHGDDDEKIFPPHNICEIQENLTKLCDHHNENRVKKIDSEDVGVSLASKLNSCTSFNNVISVHYEEVSAASVGSISHNDTTITQDTIDLDSTLVDSPLNNSSKSVTDRNKRFSTAIDDLFATLTSSQDLSISPSNNHMSYIDESHHDNLSNCNDSDMERYSQQFLQNDTEKALSNYKGDEELIQDNNYTSKSLHDLITKQEMEDIMTITIHSVDNLSSSSGRARHDKQSLVNGVSEEKQYGDKNSILESTQSYDDVVGNNIVDKGVEHDDFRGNNQESETRNNQKIEEDCLVLSDFVGKNHNDQNKSHNKENFDNLQQCEGIDGYVNSPKLHLNQGSVSVLSNNESPKCSGRSVGTSAQTSSKNIRSPVTPSKSYKEESSVSEGPRTANGFQELQNQDSASVKNTYDIDEQGSLSEIDGSDRIKYAYDGEIESNIQNEDEDYVVSKNIDTLSGTNVVRLFSDDEDYSEHNPNNVGHKSSVCKFLDRSLDETNKGGSLHSCKSNDNKLKSGNDEIRSKNNDDLSSTIHSKGRETKLEPRSGESELAHVSNTTKVGILKQLKESYLNSRENNLSYYNLRDSDLLRSSQRKQTRLDTGIGKYNARKEENNTDSGGKIFNSAHLISSSTVLENGNIHNSKVQLSSTLYKSPTKDTLDNPKSTRRAAQQGEGVLHFSKDSYLENADINQIQVEDMSMTLTSQIDLASPEDVDSNEVADICAQFLNIVINNSLRDVCNGDCHSDYTIPFSSGRHESLSRKLPERDTSLIKRNKRRQKKEESDEGVDSALTKHKLHQNLLEHNSLSEDDSPRMFVNNCTQEQSSKQRKPYLVFSCLHPLQDFTELNAIRNTHSGNDLLDSNTLVDGKKSLWKTLRGIVSSEIVTNDPNDMINPGHSNGEAFTSTSSKSKRITENKDVGCQNELPDISSNFDSNIARKSDSVGSCKNTHTSPVRKVTIHLIDFDEAGNPLPYSGLNTGKDYHIDGNKKLPHNDMARNNSAVYSPSQNTHLQYLKTFDVIPELKDNERQIDCSLTPETNKNLLILNKPLPGLSLDLQSTTRSDAVFDETSLLNLADLTQQSTARTEATEVFISPNKSPIVGDTVPTNHTFTPPSAKPTLNTAGSLVVTPPATFRSHVKMDPIMSDSEYEYEYEYEYTIEETQGSKTQSMEDHLFGENLNKVPLALRTTQEINEIVDRKLSKNSIYNRPPTFIFCPSTKTISKVETVKDRYTKLLRDSRMIVATKQASINITDLTSRRFKGNSSRPRTGPINNSRRAPRKIIVI